MHSPKAASINQWGDAWHQGDRTCTQTTDFTARSGKLQPDLTTVRATRSMGRLAWLGAVASLWLCTLPPLALAQTAADPESSPGPLRQIAPVEFPHAMVV